MQWDSYLKYSMEKDHNCYIMTGADIVHLLKHSNIGLLFSVYLLLFV